jgi:hypothetical protein
MIRKTFGEGDMMRKPALRDRIVSPLKTSGEYAQAT